MTTPTFDFGPKWTTTDRRGNEMTNVAIHVREARRVRSAARKMKNFPEIVQRYQGMAAAHMTLARRTKADNLRGQE